MLEYLLAVVGILLLLIGLTGVIKPSRRFRVRTRRRALFLLLAGLILVVGAFLAARTGIVRLEAHAAFYGDFMRLWGKANLPDDALLVYEIRQTRVEYGKEVRGVRGREFGLVKVKDGAFEKSVNTYGFPTGPIQVRVLFTTSLPIPDSDVAQPAQVMKRFGRLGWRIRGEQAVRYHGVKVAETAVGVQKLETLAPGPVLEAPESSATPSVAEPRGAAGI